MKHTGAGATTAIVMILALSAGNAWAQASQLDPKHAPAEKIEPCPDKQQPGGLACGPGHTSAPTHKTVKKPAPKHQPQKLQPKGNLSGQLQQSHGTIKPPASVDPGMVTQPPHAQDHGMPVIPPPGTPGGNPHIIPQ